MSTQEPGPQEPSEEELREALKQLKVQDVVLQTVVTLVNLTGRRLTAEGEKDLDQARQGIEAVRALLPLCPQDELGPVKDAVSQLQMIYVRETGGGGEQQERPAEPEPPKGDEPSRIWTPPGS
jgi:hypothetical protein